MPATLKQVAAAAGVHVSTVSRALNPATRHLVAAASAERVREVAARLGYRPDVAAAGLRTGRSRLVGALVPGIANPVFGPILGGAAEALAAEGYALIVADPGDDPARATDLVAEFAARRVDGLLLATAARRGDPALAVARERGLPAVLVNRTAPGVPGVASDDATGMALSVDHLLDLGHRRIGHLGGPPHLSTGHGRLAGFRAAMRRHGLRGPDAAADAYDRAAGAAAAWRLLDAGGVTAICAANDLLALGAYDALCEAGLRVPADVSVTGHNDMPLVDLVDPPLTTVRIAPRGMGATGARMLLRVIGGERPEDVTVAPSFVVRRSTAAPRGGG